MSQTPEAQQALASLLALLPPGRAWTRTPGTRMHDLLTAIAQEYGRVIARARQLVDESIPTHATELLPEWEELTGATGCSTPGTLELRRRAVVERLRGGAPTYPALEDLVLGAGYEAVELYTWAPFRCGVSAAGDALTNDEWQHSVEVRYEPRSPEDDAALECTIDDLLHAHVLPVYREADWLELSDGSPLELSGLVLEVPT